jgi:hypothetical protein
LTFLFSISDWRSEITIGEISHGDRTQCRERLEQELTLSSKQYLRLADLSDSAINVWKMAAKHYKTSYLAWTTYTDLLMCVLCLLALTDPNDLFVKKTRPA